MRMFSLECFASLEKQRLARFVEPECPPADAIFQLGFIATVPVSCLHGTEIVSDAMFQLWFFTPLDPQASTVHEKCPLPRSGNGSLKRSVCAPEACYARMELLTCDGSSTVFPPRQGCATGRSSWTSAGFNGSTSSRPHPRQEIWRCKSGISIPLQQQYCSRRKTKLWDSTARPCTKHVTKVPAFIECGGSELQVMQKRGW